MMKTVLAGATILAIAGTSLVYAQQGPGNDRGAQRWRPTAEDVTAFGDAKIAGLKAGLKLTAEQEKHWPAVETALRDLAKQRSARIMARGDAKDDANKDAKRPDPIERLNMRAERMTQTGTGLKKLADAAKPLYQSLDEGQKRRFVILARAEMRNGMGPGRERGHHARHHGRHGGPDRHGPAAPAPR